jgi:hypothetical protein
MQIRLILALIALGFALVATGELPRVTHFFMRLAIEAQKNDVVSLGHWNRALIGGATHVR